MSHYIREIAERYGIDPAPVFAAYAEPQRYYHTLHHINSMLARWHHSPLVSTDALGMAIVFHDICYDPRSMQNEADSARLFNQLYTGDNDRFRKQVTDLIRITDHTTKPTTVLERALCEWDLWAYIYGPVSQLLQDDFLIFKEYQLYDWQAYQQGRIRVLTRLSTNSLVNPTLVQAVIEHNQTWQPRIALAVFSANSMPTDHLRVIRKVEDTFDKVIIGIVNDPEKTVRLPPELSFHQIVWIEELSADFRNGFSYPVTLLDYAL
ncbi:hypothetical protein GCM10027347_12830 [Larkinella harenae]